VCVDLERDGQAGVAEDDLRVAGRDSECLQERGDRVPDVVHGDEPDVVVVADAAKGAHQVARLYRDGLDGLPADPTGLN